MSTRKDACMHACIQLMLFTSINKPPLNLLDNSISIDFHHFLLSCRCIKKELLKTSKCMHSLVFPYPGTLKKLPLKQKAHKEYIIEKVKTIAVETIQDGAN